MDFSFSIDELKAIVAPTAVRGASGGGEVRRIASLDDATTGDLTFLSNNKFRAKVAESEASAILVGSDFEGEPRAGQYFLVVDNPSVALAQVCARLEHALWPKLDAGIHPSAIVGEGARIAPSATVGPLCVIEAGAIIGEGTILQAQVFIGRNASVGRDCWLAPHTHVSTHCSLADRCRLHAGVVVGSDGFGYEVVEGRHAKVPQVGIVEVHNDVEIGANSSLDRARFSRTVIGEGTKIDNLVQVGHNVIVGKHCILCAQVGIAGSTTLEDYVVMGGQAGAAGHIRVAQGTQVAGRGGLTANITEPGLVYSGMPAMPYRLERRLVVLQRRLPDLFKDVKSLLNDIAELKKVSAE